MNNLNRGPILITESQTLDLSKYGIKVGDPLNVICIGGGGGGGTSRDSRGTGGSGGQDGVTASEAYGGKPGIGGRGYGAGGGGGAGYDDSDYGGGGGGSGYVAMKTIVLNTTTSVSITIGAGGASDSNGGTTSFGSYLSATGGYKGGKPYQPNGLTWYDGKGGNGGNKGESGKNDIDGGNGADGFIITGIYKAETSTQYLSNNNGNGCVAIWY